jgi:hypothetical protein
MLKLSLIPTVAFLSFTVFAEVSFDEKRERVRFIEKLGGTVNAVNVEAYRRELEYERDQLPLDLRAEREARFFVDRLSAHIRTTYLERAEATEPNAALNSLREDIEADLAHVAPELRSEIEALANSALEDVSRGETGLRADFFRLQGAMLREVRNRVEFLNRPGRALRPAPLLLVEGPVILQLTRSQLRNTTKRQVLEGLVSEQELAPFFLGASMSVRSDQATRTDGRVSVQLKADFLGASIEAGPSVSFSRTYRTQAIVMAEGLAPVLGPDGAFDRTKRDRFNNPTGARTITIGCEASLDFSADYSGSGGFSVIGVGGSAAVTKHYANSVRVVSNRLVLPQTIDGKPVDLRSLGQLCHQDFLKARVTSTVDVAGSLNLMMRNVLAGVLITRGR